MGAFEQLVGVAWSGTVLAFLRHWRTWTVMLLEHEADIRVLKDRLANLEAECERLKDSTTRDAIRSGDVYADLEGEPPDWGDTPY